jgi:hypothetical protein
MLPSIPLRRRQFLQVGASSFLGLGLTGLLAGRAATAAGPAAAGATGDLSAAASRSRSVILVWLGGGLSQLDSLDMKPDAPIEIRGEFDPIATAVPGIQISEHLPRLATRMRQWTIVRSLSHRDNDHLAATHRTLTGAPMPAQRAGDTQLSRQNWPCYAAGLNFVRPRSDGLPSGVTLPHPLVEGSLTWPGQHAGFLGPTHDPALVTQDPNLPTFRMDTYRLHGDIEPSRMDDRRRLLGQLGRTSMGEHSFQKHQDMALEILSSGRLADAYRIDREPDQVRDRYGRNQFGQSLLLARRLVQAGVPIIQANMGIVQSWDTHGDNWGRLKSRLLPWLDQAVTALSDDLEASGLLGDTLVAVLGEFGRTPKINNSAGRDHWASVYSGMFAGGGVRGGRVIGESDRTSSFPITEGFTPYDVGATVYRSLGIDPAATIRDALNRPLQLNSGRVIQSLFRDV